MKIAFFTLIISSFSILSLSQDRLVHEGSNWYHCNPDDTLGNPMADYTYYEFVKDTVVAGEKCKFIYSSGDDRVIILEKEDKVYYYALDRFNLLYDFNVDVTDTIYLDMRVLTFLLSASDEIILIDTILSVMSTVQEVDSISVEDHFLKKVVVDIFPESDLLENATWPSSFGYYEYLGYIVDGFIPAIIQGFGPAINTNRTLRCYSDTRFFYTENYWEQFGEDCDFKITSAKELNFTETLSPYPNPVQELLTIKCGYSTLKKLELRDSTGKLLILKENFPEPFEIQLGNLKPGLYLLLIQTSDIKTIHVNRIVKI